MSLAQARPAPLAGRLPNEDDRTRPRTVARLRTCAAVAGRGPRQLSDQPRGGRPGHPQEVDSCFPSRDRAGGGAQGGLSGHASGEREGNNHVPGASDLRELAAPGVQGVGAERGGQLRGDEAGGTGGQGPAAERGGGGGPAETEREGWDV